ncbi:MAG: catalase, partial [Thermomonas sp.]
MATRKNDKTTTSGRSRSASPALAPKRAKSSADVESGNSGERQDQAGGTHPTMTTAQGIAIPDNQNSLRSNPRGPTLLEDFILREKITHFDHERIP